VSGKKWNRFVIRATEKFLERERPEFTSPLLWRPNSPDSNPVDYSVWSVLQEKVYKTCITDLDDLKHCIRTEWANMDRRRDCCICALVASSSFRLCQGGRRSFRTMLLILTLCFCDNCGFWSLRCLHVVESNSCRLIFRSDFLVVVSYDAVRFNTWRSFNLQGKVVTLFRCGGHACVVLV